ncbi:hypothetical protein PRZ48_009047 [Zasmidium cellare]|uniref:Uncharacterized protein n=1 Tax=Zasmidium cellare TaxID=395010 RepID=A0ABR0EH81_ZASCE|nr:hypothetical protein PRZ48_009047 [Zasmidium cellare]
MNHSNHDGGWGRDRDEQRLPQLRSPPPRDGSPRSDVAALNGASKKRDYVPFQDALYYNNDNSASYGSNSSDRDPRDRRYSEVYERVRRRRRNGTEGFWEDRRYEPSRYPVTEYHGKQRYEDDEQPPPPPLPMNGHDDHRYDDRKTDDRKFKRPDRRSRSSSSSRSRHSDRSRKSKRQDRRNRDDSRSRSRSRSRAGSQKNTGPDPNTRPQDDPNRPSEGYTALKALKAAAWAGGVEVVRCRMEPGPWTGQKGKRVALAATVGVAIGALRNGRNQASGKMPYAEAAMTGFYAIDFLKRVARHTEHGKNSVKEQEEWNRDPEEIRGREERTRRFAGGG